MNTISLNELVKEAKKKRQSKSLLLVRLSREKISGNEIRRHENRRNEIRQNEIRQNETIQV